MKLIVLNLIFLASSVAFSCNGQDNNNGASPNSLRTISSEKITELVSFFPNSEPGGTFLVTQNGEHIVSGSQGKANLELDINMQTSNVFNLASVTKPFTAVAIFKLIEEGKISLDDKVSTYIIGFPEKGQKITIGHLLSHSSGMGYKNDEEDQIKLKKDIWKIGGKDTISIAEYFTENKFDTLPGTQYDYNNVAYDILGYIIEKVSGKTYESYLREVFFEPLEMKNTYLESSTKIIKNRATGYDSFDGINYQIKKSYDDDSYFYSANGLMSTVEDLSIWYEALMNYRIISKISVDKLTTPIRYKDGTYASNGYGVFTGNLNGNDYILHNGLTWGYGSMVLYFPKEKLFIGHLRNCGYCNYDRILSYSVPILIASTLLDSEFSDEDYSIQTFKGDLAGTYHSSLSQQDKVIVQNGNKLFLESRFGLRPLLQINERTFFVVNNNETITFETLKNKVELISNRGFPIRFKR